MGVLPLPEWDNKSLPTNNIEYFAKRKLEDYVNIDVVDTISKQGYEHLRKEKDKLIENIKNSTVYIYSDDVIYKIINIDNIAGDYTEKKKVTLDEVLNLAKYPEKIKEYLS